MNRAKGNIPALKRAVVEIATIKKAPIDLLANYLAYRLSLQGESWWGTANNLQYTDPAPLELARQMFMSGVKVSHLEPQKREVLLQALKDSDSEEDFDGSEA